MSWLWRGEGVQRREGRDGPVNVVPEKELVVDGYPYAVYLREEAHVRGDVGGWWMYERGRETWGRDGLL